MVQQGGTGWGRNPPRPLLAVPNVTAHPSAASVPITVLLYNGALLCVVLGSLHFLWHYAILELHSRSDDDKG